MSVATGAITSIVVNGVTLEAIERGRGRPILFLHPGIGIEPDAPVLAELARGGRLLAPTHPGFGTSQLPKGMSTVDDLSYFYLDLLDQLGDVVQGESGPEVPEIAGHHLEDVPRGGGASSRQPASERFVDDLPEGSP